MSNYSDFLINYFNELETILVNKGYITISGGGEQEVTPTISGSTITNYGSNQFYCVVGSGTGDVDSGTINWVGPTINPNGYYGLHIYAVSIGKILSNPSETYYVNGNDSYTKLLLHMDGSDNGTSFVDSSSNPKTITRYNALTKTDIKKFGLASGYFGGSGYYLSVADSADWDFGSGDFTIDFHVRLNTTSGYQTLLSVDNNTGTRSWVIQTGDGNGNLVWVVPYGVATVANGILSQGVWAHIAIVRYGNVVSIYKDGILQTSHDYGAGYTVPSSTLPLEIGRQGNYENYANCYLDEVRISKGIARWTSNFTPPTVAYY